MIPNEGIMAAFVRRDWGKPQSIFANLAVDPTILQTWHAPPQSQACRVTTTPFLSMSFQFFAPAQEKQTSPYSLQLWADGPALRIW